MFQSKIVNPATLDTDLPTMTPVEIDTALYALYCDQTSAIREVERWTGYINSAIDHLTADQNRALARGQTIPASVLDREQERIEGYRTQRATARLEVERIGDLMAPYEQEYARRPWTRAFYVTNTGGHVHHTMGCSTCYPTTRFMWLVDWSGRDEAEIVDAAADKACTVCYPSAPVDRPTTMDLEPAEAKAARLAREARKAEIAAAKIAKGITDADGSVLRVFSWHCAERVIRERDGSERVIPAHDNYDRLETLHAAKTWLTDRAEDRGYQTIGEGDLERVTAAVAAKEGKSTEQVWSEAQARAAKRAKRY